jgi:hypothetical protein
MKVKRVQIQKVKFQFKRVCLHLCLLLGAMSLVVDQLPSLFSTQESSQVLEARRQNFDPKESPDKMLAEAISATQKKPSILKPKAKFHTVDTFAELLKQKGSSPLKKQLLESLANDKLALWSVFSNLSTYSGLVEILNQPIQAFERQTLRSESFGIAAGFDQIIYRLHLENGGTSLVVAKVQEGQVMVSLYRAPEASSGSYTVQSFKEGLWSDSREILLSQVEQEISKTKDGSAVVLSASVGL